MKKIFLLILALFPLTIRANKLPSTDSVYYLLDTTKIPKNERMWEIGYEGQIKYFSILCPCLEFGAYPTFTYRTDKEILKSISLTDVKSFQLISLPHLLSKCRQLAGSKQAHQLIIFIIEPYKTSFKVSTAYLQPPIKPYKVEDKIYIEHDKKDN